MPVENEEMLDLRETAAELVQLIIESRCLQVEKNACLWLIFDHDPIEHYEFLCELGFNVQTFIFSPNEYRIFLGKL